MNVLNKIKSKPKISQNLQQSQQSTTKQQCIMPSSLPQHLQLEPKRYLNKTYSQQTSNANLKNQLAQKSSTNKNSLISISNARGAPIPGNQGISIFNNRENSILENCQTYNKNASKDFKHALSGTSMTSKIFSGMVQSSYQFETEDQSVFSSFKEQLSLKESKKLQPSSAELSGSFCMQVNKGYLIGDICVFEGKIGGHFLILSCSCSLVTSLVACPEAICKLYLRKYNMTGEAEAIFEAKDLLKTTERKKH